MIFHGLWANETWIFQINGTVRGGTTNNLRLKMSLPGTPTNCSNSALRYNGSAAANGACNTDLLLTSINNQALTDLRPILIFWHLQDGLRVRHSLCLHKVRQQISKELRVQE